MTKIEMKSKGAASRSLEMKHRRFLSAAAVLLVCCLAFVGAAGAEESTPVAEVNSIQYTNIDWAISNWTDGTTLTLLADVTLSKTIEINSNEQRILDLNRYNITLDEDIKNGRYAIIIICQGQETPKPALTINANADNPGRIDVNICVSYKRVDSNNIKSDNSTLVINGGVYDGIIQSDSTLNNMHHLPQININGGTFNKKVTAPYGTNLLISGGTFNKKVEASGKLWISGGTFNDEVSLTTGNKEVQISGGTFNKVSISAEGVQISGGIFDGTVSFNGNSDAEISGGTFTDKVTLTEGGNSKLEISDGKFDEGVTLSAGELKISGDSSVTVKDKDGYIISSETDEYGNIKYTTDNIPSEAESRIVTFNTNGGSPIGTYNVKSGSTITEPADPTREGYKFEGWYSNEGLTTSYEFSTEVTEALTLYAKWTIKQYTITFNTDGGSAVEPITQDYNTAVIAPSDPTRDGYTFKGWDKEIPATMPAEDITITALWEEIPVEEPAITPSTSSGSGSEGNYLSYPRTTVNGGLVDFGSSKAVKAVLLPEGSSGSVVLKVDTIEKWPKELETEYTFDISVEKLGEGMAYIHFEIPESSLESLGITSADICVYHLVDDVWVKLITTYEVKDGTVFYEAETDSFSPFKLVIEEGAAEPKAEETEPVIPPTEEPEDKPQEELPPIEPPVQPTEPESPSPILAVLAGLGAAAVLRRK